MLLVVRVLFIWIQESMFMNLYNSQNYMVGRFGALGVVSQCPSKPWKWLNNGGWLAFRTQVWHGNHIKHTFYVWWPYFFISVKRGLMNFYHAMKCSYLYHFLFDIILGSWLTWERYWARRWIHDQWERAPG